MRYSTDKLIEVINNNKPVKGKHQNHSNSLHYYPEQEILCSYRETIAEFHNEGVVIVYNKTAKGNNYFSQTTSTHINKLINYLEKEKKEYLLLNYNDDGTVKEDTENQRRNT